MKEENVIRKITEGSGNPFRVPEGYFDDFTGRLMASLPVQKRKPRIATYVWRYAAVLLVVLGVGLTAFLATKADESLAEGGQTEQYQEDYINEALDYAMISNSSIELYLTEAN